MKICKYLAGSTATTGLVVGDEIIPLLNTSITTILDATDPDAAVEAAKQGTTAVR